ncbi:MAG: FAD-binding protein [Alphaproteobacteria bacterium]|nr:FAD-binding protein [Alphaproteobacteria bacterium]
MKRRDFVTSALGAAAISSVPYTRASANDLSAKTLSGGETVLSNAEIKEFGDSLRGKLLRPTSDGYDRARKVWNGVWNDQRPALVARCSGIKDVLNAVEFARTHDLLVALRGGGHSISGKSICEGGMVIDMSLMDSVHVDPFEKTARVEPGVLLGALDRASQHFGLATTAGVVSHTGAAGLTLGGGIGRLQRKHGLTIDNLLSADVITPDGQFLRASEADNADLFWGLRGGGGNFGIVTSFEYQLHHVGPKVLNVSFMYPISEAKDVLNFYFDFNMNAPDDLYIGAGLAMPPGESGFAMISGCYFGDFAEGERLIEPLRKFGKPLFSNVGPIDYVDLQSRNDRNNQHGHFYYAKSGFFTDIETAVIDNAVDRFEGTSSRRTLLLISPFGGAVGRVAEDATAFTHRDTQYQIEISSGWEDDSLSDDNVQWCRRYWDALEPFTSGGFYVNFIVDQQQQQRLNENYRGNYDRLVALKNKYDPTNFLRLNANIEPTV